MRALRSAVARPAALAIAAVVTLALAAGPASAQTVSVSDKHESYLPPRLDLDGARYTVDSAGFEAKVTVTDLVAGIYSLGFNLTVPGSEESIHILVTRKSATKFINTVTLDLTDEQVSRHCGGLDTVWKNKLDYITVEVPWRCMDQLRKDLRVQAFFGAGLGISGDPSDFIKTVRVDYN